MKHRISIHPITLPVFVVIFFTPYKKEYFILYFFIFCHELSHMLCAFLLGEKWGKIHLYPWGCMLSINSAPDRIKSILIFLAGPLINIIFTLLKIYPDENFTLALFNLIPVMPLDGGILINLLLPHFSFLISVFSIIITFIYTVRIKRGFLLPVALLSLLIISEKNKIEKSINSKVINHFCVEKKAKKLYNTIDKL